MPKESSSQMICCLAILILACYCAWRSPGPLPAQVSAKNAEKIVYWEKDGDDSRLTALDVKDNKTRRLTSRPAPAQMHALWPALLSPDGKWAVYPGTKFYDDAEGEGMVHLRALDKPGANARSLGVKGAPVCWSPDGKHLIVTDFDDAAWTQTIIDVSKGERKALNVPALKAPKDGEAHVQIVTDWSRDGKWLVARFNPMDEKGLQKSNLYLTKSDGAEPRHLKHLGNGVIGRFSPNGKSILYLRRDGEDPPRLFVADVKPSKPVCVSQTMNGNIDDLDFCWSPDGNRVAFIWENGEMGADAESFLIVVDADGRNEKVMVSVKGEGRLLRSLNWR